MGCIVKSYIGQTPLRDIFSRTSCWKQLRVCAFNNAIGEVRSGEFLSYEILHHSLLRFLMEIEAKLHNTLTPNE